MSYVEDMTVNQILDQLEQWYHITQDPHMDGFVGRGARDKIRKVQEAAETWLKTTPTYVGDDQ